MTEPTRTVKLNANDMTVFIKDETFKNVFAARYVKAQVDFEKIASRNGLHRQAIYEGLLMRWLDKVTREYFSQTQIGEWLTHYADEDDYSLYHTHFMDVADGHFYILVNNPDLAKLLKLAFVGEL